MSKGKKSGGKPGQLEKILLATAILQLIQAIITLLEKLLGRKPLAPTTMNYNLTFAHCQYKKRQKNFTVPKFQKAHCEINQD